MSEPSQRWSVALTQEAERDFAHVLRWTSEQFGTRQAELYMAILLEAVDDLAEGPNVLGAKKRDEVAPGLLALHARRRRNKARHILYFRAGESSREITILRILHDGMDPGLHIEP